MQYVTCFDGHLKYSFRAENQFNRSSMCSPLYSCFDNKFNAITPQFKNVIRFCAPSAMGILSVLSIDFAITITVKYSVWMIETRPFFTIHWPCGALVTVRSHIYFLTKPPLSYLISSFTCGFKLTFGNYNYFIAYLHTFQNAVKNRNERQFLHQFEITATL